MPLESTIADWIVGTTYADVPDDVTELMKTLTYVIAGCTFAGATSDGCEDVTALVKSWGGAEDATILVHGGKAPVHAAVLANSVMARAHDICDFVSPGQHMGTSVVPVALAISEKVGGVSGEDFITALAVGCEIGARFGRVSRHGGFDPSGVGNVFAVTAVAGKLLGLDERKMLNALALAFNRAGGSFQSNIDASLAVRLIQGFASQNGVICAELAERGMTGPENFIGGVWGFYYLYGNDERDDESLAGALGEHWEVRSMGFKNYPSCGATIAATDAALALRERESLDPAQVESITVRLASEFPYRLVGHPFHIGPNPSVNAQFSVEYAVANAILRGFPVLEHYTTESVTDSRVRKLIERLELVCDPGLAEDNQLGRASVQVSLEDGRTFAETVDLMSGMPPNTLPKEKIVSDYFERARFGGKKVPDGQLQLLLREAETLEKNDDVRTLVPLMLA